jgi:hypothetical protein
MVVSFLVVARFAGLVVARFAGLVVARFAGSVVVRFARITVSGIARQSGGSSAIVPIRNFRAVARL